MKEVATLKPNPVQLAHLALFPLPNAVLFPSTILPLHIFEPRYRTMTAEAIEDQIPIAIVKLLDPRALDAQGRPAFHEIGGVGYLSNYQRLPDGRYNILIEGVSRVRIIEELDADKPYRVGRAELIDDQAGATGAITALLSTLRSCITGLQKDYDRLSEAIARLLNEVHHPGKLADAIASLLIAEPELRQQMLEEARVERRLDEVITRLAALLATSSPNQNPWLN